MLSTYPDILQVHKVNVMSRFHSVLDIRDLEATATATAAFYILILTNSPPSSAKQQHDT